MRLKTTFQITAVLGLAVVAGLLGVSGTWALWNVSAPANAGSVQAADFIVKVDGSPMLVNSATTTVTMVSQATGLTPENPAYAEFTLTNNTTASSPFAIEATLGVPEIASENSGLANALTVQTASKPAGGTCTTAAYQNPAKARLNVNGSQSFCLRMSLPAKASENLINSRATITIPVAVEQEGR